MITQIPVQFAVIRLCSRETSANPSAILGRSDPILTWKKRRRVLRFSVKVHFRYLNCTLIHTRNGKSERFSPLDRERIYVNVTIHQHRYPSNKSNRLTSFYTLLKFQGDSRKIERELNFVTEFFPGQNWVSLELLFAMLNSLFHGFSIVYERRLSVGLWKRDFMTRFNEHWHNVSILLRLPPSRKPVKLFFLQRNTNGWESSLTFPRNRAKCRSLFARNHSYLTPALLGW